MTNNSHHAVSTELERRWRSIAIVTLCIRFVQGWIFWGGGSRRFIYAPGKMNPYAPIWMANKLQSAMPGAILGMGKVVSFLLHHFIFLYAGILFLSLAELISGVALVLGAFTRFSAFVTVILSIIMMLIFGWQGSTCIDEWTMAICNIAIGVTLMAAGASAYSVDALLLAKYPKLHHQRWFIWMGSGAWTQAETKHRELIFFVLFLLFLFGTYDYYRGAILSRYHAGPVSATDHELGLTAGHLQANGTVSFNGYVNAGTPGTPAFFIRADLIDSQGKIIESWNGDSLTKLPTTAIHNEYEYNQFHPGFYGLVAPVGAKADITLPASPNNLQLTSGQYIFTIYSIDGRHWSLKMKTE